MDMTSDQLRLKQATRDLHGDVGGLENAAADTGKSKSQHGRAQSRADETFLTIDDARRLEANARQPHVTMTLCRLNGGVFVRLPEVDAGEGCLATGCMTMASGLGELSTSIRDMVADGVNEPHEIERCRAKLDELQRAAAEMEMTLSAMAEAAATGRAKD